MSAFIYYLCAGFAVLSLGLLCWVVYLGLQLQRQTVAFPQTLGSRPVCNHGMVYPSCVVPIGYFPDVSGGTQLISNSFGGGVALPTQLLGSTFDGAMYTWDSDTHVAGTSPEFSISRLDGIANGVTAITWGTDRADGTGLGGKTTVEQCTGYGPLVNTSDTSDWSAGWETGAIFMSDASNPDTTSFEIFPFIHIYKIELDAAGKPTKLRMWEALIEDESKSLLYTRQLQNNITAAVLWGSEDAAFETQVAEKYVASGPKYQVWYMEMFYDATRGIDVPPPSKWGRDRQLYAALQ